MVAGGRWVADAVAVAVAAAAAAAAAPPLMLTVVPREQS